MASHGFEKFLVDPDTRYAINPLHIRIRPPCPNDENGHFLLFIHGEALWKWPHTGQETFADLQHSIAPLGYSLAGRSRERLQRLLRVKTHRMKAQVSKLKNRERQKKTPAEGDGVHHL